VYRPIRSRSGSAPATSLLRCPPGVLLVAGIALGYTLGAGTLMFPGLSWWGGWMLVLGLLVLGLGLTFGLGSSRPQPADAATPSWVATLASAQLAVRGRLRLPWG
jgi:hypothetical protein